MGELGQWRGRKRAVWGRTVLPTQNGWQKVEGDAVKVVSVFAVRSKAVGKSLVQRVETKEAEAHVKMFRARNPFVKAQKQPLSFHCLQAGPSLRKLRFTGFVTERSVLAWGGLLCPGLKRSSSAGLGRGSCCRKERGGGEYGPTQNIFLILICSVAMLGVPVEITSLLWAKTDVKPLLQRLRGSGQGRWA